MLVLKREVGQKIVIGDDIVITFLRHDRGGIKLGIEAPTNVPVHRMEVWERTKNDRSLQKRPRISPTIPTWSEPMDPKPSAHRPGWRTVGREPA